MLPGWLAAGSSFVVFASVPGAEALASEASVLSHVPSARGAQVAFSATPMGDRTNGKTSNATNNRSMQG